MDLFPQNLPARRGGAWKRRQDLDGPGIAYEYSPGGLIGRATGRLSASIPAAKMPETMTWLARRGLHARTILEGAEVLVAIEASDALQPLKMFHEISSMPGLEKVEAEILMAKSKKDV